MLSKKIITAFVFFMAAASFHAESIDIYFTGSLNGNLDGCDCKEVPRAGLVKTAVEIRKRNKKTSLFIDGGDRLDVIKDPVLADYINQAYQGLEPDYLLPGDQDFINGIQFISQNPYRLPFMADNMEVRSSDLGSRKGSTLIKNGIRLYLIGLVDPAVKKLIPNSESSKITIQEPQPVLDSLAGELSGRQINILVYHGYEENLKSLLDANPGSFDIALLIHEQKYIDLTDYSGTLLFSPGPRGNRIGIIHLETDIDTITDSSWRAFAPDYMNSPDDPEVKEMLKQYYDSLTL